MDQHILRRFVLQGQKTEAGRFLSGGATGNEDDVLMLLRHSAPIKRMIVGMDDDGDCADERAIGKSAQSAGKHGLCANEPILLRPLGALPRPLAATGRHDDCCCL